MRPVYWSAGLDIASPSTTDRVTLGIDIKLQVSNLFERWVALYEVSNSNMTNEVITFVRITAQELPRTVVVVPHEENGALGREYVCAREHA